MRPAITPLTGSIGAVVEIAFLTYVFGLGRRAAAAGETGDVDQWLRVDVLESTG